MIFFFFVSGVKVHWWEYDVIGSASLGKGYRALISGNCSNCELCKENSWLFVFLSLRSGHIVEGSKFRNYGIYLCLEVIDWNVCRQSLLIEFFLKCCRRVAVKHSKFDILVHCGDETLLLKDVISFVDKDIY